MTDKRFWRFVCTSCGKIEVQQHTNKEAAHVLHMMVRGVVSVFHTSGPTNRPCGPQIFEPCL